MNIPRNEWGENEEFFLNAVLKSILMMQCYVCEISMYVRAAREYKKCKVYKLCQVWFGSEGDNLLGVPVMIGL